MSDDEEEWVFKPAAMAPITAKQEELLEELYYDKMFQRGIHSTFYEINKNLPKPGIPRISRNQVAHWLREQDLYQINLQQNKVYHINPIVTQKPFELLQVDFIMYDVVCLMRRFCGGTLRQPAMPLLAPPWTSH